MGKHTAGSRDLATPISFLVTCVQPEMLHISPHYEWMHLLPAYLTPLLIRLQITGELLIPRRLTWISLVPFGALGELSRRQVCVTFCLHDWSLWCELVWVWWLQVDFLGRCDTAATIYLSFAFMHVVLSQISLTSEVTREFRYFGLHCS